MNWRGAGTASTNKGRRLACFFKHLIIARFAKDVTLPPNLINAQAFGAIFNKFVPQLSYKRVDDLWFRFINATIKMVQKCIFAKNNTFSQRQKLIDLKFFGG